MTGRLLRLCCMRIVGLTTLPLFAHQFLFWQANEWCVSWGDQLLGLVGKEAPDVRVAFSWTPSRFKLGAADAFADALGHVQVGNGPRTFLWS